MWVWIPYLIWGWWYMITYYKLLDLLNRRNISKLELMEMACISRETLAKLSKNESVTIQTIDKICTVLKCQPGDILEWNEK